MEYAGFCAGSYIAQSPISDCEDLINLYPERSVSRGATSKASLYSTPGVQKLPLTLPHLYVPDAPTVTVQGAAGVDVFGYKIVAFLTDGVTHTQASAEGQNVFANPGVSGVNFCRVTWPAVAGASFYDVYRTTGNAVGGTHAPLKVASQLTATTYDDTVPDGLGLGQQAPPSTNITGLSIVPSGTGKAHFFDTSTQRDFVVIGTVFAEITSQFLWIFRGAVAVDANPATICTNGDGGGQLFITAGGNGYLFDLTTNVFSTIAALAGKATQGDHLDGYFLALDANTSTMFISDLLDGTTWDPTQFIQRSIQADPWVAFKVCGRYIWLLGSQTSEAWYDAGASPIPFIPYPSGVIQYGCGSPFSPEVVAGSIMWIGATINGNGEVIRLQGFTPEVVSTFATQIAFNSYGNISDAIGDTYDDLGHTFYFVTFPTANITWAWDAQTQLWHKRGTWMPSHQAFDAWRPLFHAFAFSQHWMLDLTYGNVYHMSSDFGSDVDDLPLRRVRVAPIQESELKRLYCSAFELDVETGLGLVTGQGSDPTVMLEISRDGGKTWGNQRTASIGAIGKYRTRVRFNRCGNGRRLVFRVSFTDPVPFRVVNAYLTVEAEAA